jgi:signal transduction histidine kinase
MSLESVNGESVEGPDEEGSDGIRGSEAQGDEGQRGELLGHLEATGRALGRMGAIIDDVLTLTWGGRDLRPDDLSPRSLGALAEAAWEQVDTAEARLQLDAPPSFRCDKDRRQRLLENLFRNAVEHAGEAAVVRAGGLPDEFYVEDNAPGIPEAERETVLRGGYSSRGEGTGLGLSIVQKIADAHGWSLSVTEGGEGGAWLEVRGAEPLSG